MDPHTVRSRPAYALISMALACALGVWPAAARAQTSPALPALASAIIPGLGQAINGDYGEATAHFGVYALSLSAGLYYQRKPDFLSDDMRYDDANNREFITQPTFAPISPCASPPIPRSIPPSPPTATRERATAAATGLRRRRNPSPISRSRRSPGNSCRARRPSSRSPSRPWRRRARA